MGNQIYCLTATRPVQNNVSELIFKTSLDLYKLKENEKSFKVNPFHVVVRTEFARSFFLKFEGVWFIAQIKNGLEGALLEYIVPTWALELPLIADAMPNSSFIIPLNRDLPKFSPKPFPSSSSYH